MDEKQYRKLSSEKYFHYSLLSSVSREGGAALIKEKKDTRSTSFGSLVHVMCLQEEEFDKRYRVSKIAYSLSAQFQILFDEISRAVEHKQIDPNDIINTSDDYRNLCLNIIKDKSLFNHINDPNKLILKVIDDDFVTFLYDKVKNDDRHIIDTETYLKAELCKKALQEHLSTEKYFNPTKDASKYQIINEYGVVFKWLEENFKILIDKIFVDHENKHVFSIDLKTGSRSHRHFSDEIYTYRYDIQAVIARKALEKYVKKELGNKYTIHSPKIVYVNAEENNYTVPVTFHLDTHLIRYSVYGINYKNRYYKGIQELVNDIKHYRKTNQYYIDKQTSDNESNIYLDSDIIDTRGGFVKEVFEYPTPVEIELETGDTMDISDGRRTRRTFTTTTAIRSGDIVQASDSAFERAVERARRANNERDEQIRQEIHRRAQDLMNDTEVPGTAPDDPIESGF